MTEIEQRAREVLADVLGLRGAQRQSYDDGNFIPIVFPSDATAAMLTFAREREAEAIEKAAEVAEERAAGRSALYEENGAGINAFKAVEAEEIATAIRELNTPSEIGGEG